MVEPYFNDGDRQLYLGDALTLHELWTGQDVLICDPPYGIAYWSNYGRKAAIEADHDESFRDTLLALWGDEKAALMFGTWKMPKPPQTRALLIWDKGSNVGMGDLRIPWRPNHEEVYVLGGIERGFKGKRESGVLHYDNPAFSSKRTDHPTPKPVALMEALVAKTVGTIADPTAGTGATLLAAKNLGRKAVGIEIDEAYCEIAARRLSQGVFDFELD